MSTKNDLRLKIKAEKAAISALHERIEEARLQQELDRLREHAARLRQELTEQNARCAPEEPAPSSECDASTSRSWPTCSRYWSCEDCPCEECRAACEPNVVAFRR